jgi:hypothetical protein
MHKPRCTICGVVADRICGTCETTSYCSLDCSHTDLPLHQLLCTKYSTAIALRSPHFTNCLAIHFPRHQTKPVFVWVPIRQGHPSDTERRVQAAEIEEFVDETNVMSSVTFNSIRNRPLKGEIRIFAEEGKSLNNAVSQTLALGKIWAKENPE